MLFSAPVQAAPCRGKLGFKWAVRSVILMTRFCRYFMSRSNSRQFIEFNFRETITNQPAGGTVGRVCRRVVLLRGSDKVLCFAGLTGHQVYVVVLMGD